MAYIEFRNITKEFGDNRVLDQVNMEVKREMWIRDRIYNSNHLALAEHKPFTPGKENTPKVTIVEKMKNRVMVGDTDLGKELAGRIEDLKELVAAYREGIIKEKMV